MRWRTACWWIPLGLMLGSGVCLLRVATEAVTLRRFARTVVDPAATPEAQVLALCQWVYESRPTAPNRSCFLVDALGATPLQILQAGGDCADKARLLTALCHALGMSATPVMLFDPQTGHAVHTVVEVEASPEWFLVVDPSYNLYFPRGHDGFYDLFALRREPRIARDRVAEATRIAPWPSRIHFMNPHGYNYTTASTFNWNEGRFSRLLFAVLHAVHGEDVYRLRRPAWLENPPLAVGLMLFGSSAGAALLLLILRRLTPRSRRSTRRAIPLVTTDRSPRYSACGSPRTWRPAHLP